uniref:Uncharacterized protein n=1 Tax=Solanum lycopersicum TaxID=4081 RepID=K4CGS5_SOLLC
MALFKISSLFVVQNISNHQQVPFTAQKCDDTTKEKIKMQTAEAESLSQNQQRRIDELEAQLNEAEGLIIDLRAELHDVREQLNEVKNKPLHHLRPHAEEVLNCRNSIMAKSNVNNSELLKFPTELGSKVCKSSRNGKTKNSSCKARSNKFMFSQRLLPAIFRCSARYLHTDTLYDSPNCPSINTEKNNVAGSSFVSGKEGPQYDASQVYVQ